MNAKEQILAMRRDLRLLQLSGDLPESTAEHIRHELWLAYVELCLADLTELELQEND